MRVVSLEPKSEMLEVPSVRLTLDLGDEYLVLRGYFSRGDEFIEKAASTHSKGKHSPGPEGTRLHRMPRLLAHTFKQ